MRFLMIADALDRIIFSLLPGNLTFPVSELPYILTIDILCNYCFDFWIGLAVLWVQIALIFTLNDLRNIENVSESLQSSVLVTLMMTLIYMLIAMSFGSLAIRRFE